MYLRCGLTFINTRQISIVITDIIFIIHREGTFHSITIEQLTSVKIKVLVATITEPLTGALSTLLNFTNDHNSPIIMVLVFLF